MSQTAIVVEDGVIQCEHGGKVVLQSSESVHVIGGKKPLHDIDLMGAPIQGCPYYAPVGGNCTSVASITSAVTEENVSAGGLKYLLRVDGCKTDKGAALVLVDPGQTNSTVPSKSEGGAGSITQKELEDAKLDTKENIKKEKYRIHPLRKSNGKVRALRGARDFQVIKNHHHVAANQYTHDKIVTKADAYLYVTHDGETLEYKVVNRGDFFDPTIQQVQFIDPKGTIRKHIPFYKEEGKMEIIYANVKLSEDDRTNFKPSIITIGDPKNRHVQHHKNYSKSVKYEEKSIKKIFLSQKEAKRLNKAYLNIVVPIEDPIGEVEDLYNDYEFSYHHHYGMNKGLIDDIREKNRYPYAVADMLDYLYVSEKEKEDYETQNEALKKQYDKLVTLVKTKMGSKIEEQMAGNNLSPALDHKVATDYYDELNFICKDFFKGYYSFSFKGENEQRIMGRRGQASRNNNLNISGKAFTSLKDNNSKATAYLTLSVCFSSKYVQSRTAELQQEAETFYYQIKNAKPLPQINETAIDEIRDELKYQSELTDIFDGKDPLLDEFEQLDSLLKEIAFNPNKAMQKRKAKSDYGFNSLKIGKATQEIYCNKSIATPIELCGKLRTVLADAKLSSFLNTYKDIKHFQSPQDEHNFYHYLLNLSYLLIAPRTHMDKETRALSPFNNRNKAILDLIIHLTIQLNSIGKDKAEKLDNEVIKEYYLDALYALIGHAKMEKSDYGKKSAFNDFLNTLNADNQGRESNATALLNNFEQEVPKQEINIEKPLDNNFDKDLKTKTESEKLYAALKQLDGFTSYLDKYDSTADQVKEEEKKKKRRGGEQNKSVPENTFRDNLKYKKLLTATQTISFLITIGKINDYIHGKEKLKIHNLIGFAADTLSVANDINKAMELKVKKLPQSLQHIITPEKLHSNHHFKVMARFGIIAAVANSINDTNTINQEENHDLYVATNTKNAFYIALMFAPAWWALGGIAVVELVWFFLKNKIESSKMEFYLYKSLLFNTTTHNAKRTFNEQEGNGYKASIFLDTLRHSGSKYDFAHFQSLDAVRNFIADIYPKEKHTIEAAMKNELSQLKSIMYGINLTPNEDKRTFINSEVQTEYNHYHSYSYLTLSSALVNNFTHFIQLHNGEPLENQKVFEVDDDNNVVYNTLWEDTSNLVEALGHMDASEIIVATQKVALKYKIIYEYQKNPYGNELSDQQLYINRLSIIEVKTVPMTSKDYQLIQ